MDSVLIRNLKAAMRNQEINAINLARQADLKPSFVYDILSGKSTNPSTQRLAKIAEVLQIPLTELLGLTEPFAPPRKPGEGYVAISSILAMGAAEGGTSVIEEKQGEPYYFRRSWIQDRLGAKPEDLRMIFIAGDSMEPTLCQGDMILVDITKKNPSPPGIFVLFDGLGLVAKRIEFLSHSRPPSIRILSDNPQYLPYERHIAETEIIGRVVWFAREI